MEVIENFFFSRHSFWEVCFGVCLKVILHSGKYGTI